MNKKKFWSVVSKAALIVTVVGGIVGVLAYLSGSGGGLVFGVIEQNQDVSVTVVIGSDYDAGGCELVDPVESPSGGDCDAIIGTVIGMLQEEAYEILTEAGYRVGSQCSEKNEPDDKKTYYVIDVFRSKEDPNHLMMELSKDKP